MTSLFPTLNLIAGLKYSKFQPLYVESFCGGRMWGWQYQLMCGKAKEILRKLQVRRNTQIPQLVWCTFLGFSCDTQSILTWQMKSGITL